MGDRWDQQDQGGRGNQIAQDGWDQHGMDQHDLSYDDPARYGMQGGQDGLGAPLDPEEEKASLKAEKAAQKAAAKAQKDGAKAAATAQKEEEKAVKLQAKEEAKQRAEAEAGGGKAAAKAAKEAMKAQKEEEKAAAKAAKEEAKAAAKAAKVDKGVTVILHHPLRLFIWIPCIKNSAVRRNDITAPVYAKEATKSNRQVDELAAMQGASAVGQGATVGQPERGGPELYGGQHDGLEPEPDIYAQREADLRQMEVAPPPLCPARGAPARRCRRADPADQAHTVELRIAHDGLSQPGPEAGLVPMPSVSRGKVKKNFAAFACCGSKPPKVTPPPWCRSEPSHAAPPTPRSAPRSRPRPATTAVWGRRCRTTTRR
jgi:hypothetical protein